MSEAMPVKDAIVQPSPEVKSRLDAIRATTDRIDQKIKLMTPEQKSRFSGAIEHVLLPDAATREFRGALSTFFGLGGGMVVAAERTYEMGGRGFEQMKTPTAFFQEGVAHLQSLTEWGGAEAALYVLCQTAANLPQMSVVAGAAGIATCVAGWVADKVTNRKNKLQFRL